MLEFATETLHESRSERRRSGDGKLAVEVESASVAAQMASNGTDGVLFSMQGCARPTTAARIQGLNRF